LGRIRPDFGWSDTWQLVINTATTIVTFLMVFVIQNTQTRDTQAMQPSWTSLSASMRWRATRSLVLKKYPKPMSSG
jgi:low affinity Fe/Cu permease